MADQTTAPAPSPNADITKDIGAGFATRAMSAVPQSLLKYLGAGLGIACTVALMLQMLGLAGPAQRVIDAVVSRFEHSAKDIQGAVDRLHAIVTRIDSLEKRSTNTESIAANIDGRVTRIEGELKTHRDAINDLAARQDEKTQPSAATPKQPAKRAVQFPLPKPEDAKPSASALKPNALVTNWYPWRNQ